MRILHVAAAILISGSLSGATAAESLRADHPIIGTWKITSPGGSCYEIYWFRANGTTLVNSADEVTESEVEISDQPSPKGFYKWVDKIVRDNGKKDCSGHISEIGHVATNYIRFHEFGDRFVICDKEDLNACIGPFVRMKDSDV